MAGTPASSVSSGAGALTQIYDNIAAGAIASWDVQNIAQTYSHLKLVISARGSDAAANVNAVVRFNNDASAIYDMELMYAQNVTVTDNAVVAQTGAIVGFIPSAGATAGKPGPVELIIPDYASATLHKAIITRNGMSTSEVAGGQFNFAGYACWRSAAAITRVTVLPSAGNFVAGSRLSIYGLT